MKLLSRAWARLRGHVQEHVSKYAVLLTGVLVPASTLLGDLAADIGADTKVGHVVAMAASGLLTGASAVTYIRNLGIWQMLDQFGTAPGAPAPAPAKKGTGASS